jgi:hypothetical protein
MILNEYLTQQLDNTVMVLLSIDNKEIFQYNYWNWISETNQLHLLNDNLSIVHIIYTTGIIEINENGSISYKSKYHPQNCIINFYFGKAIP